MIDEWLSFGDGEKVLGEKYHYEVMKKIFGSDDDDEFANGELDSYINAFQREYPNAIKKDISFLMS